MTGTTVVTASGGLATFNQVAVDSGGTNYQLMASSSGLNSGTTSVFNIDAPTTTSDGGDDPSFTTTIITSTTSDGDDYPSFTTTTITTINAPISALNSNGTIQINSTVRCAYPHFPTTDRLF